MVMKGTLEGLESSWDSPGLGEHHVEFNELPEVGKRFRTFVKGKPGVHTTEVVRVRSLGHSTVGFMTRNTTYILNVTDATTTEPELDPIDPSDLPQAF